MTVDLLKIVYIFSMFSDYNTKQELMDCYVHTRNIVNPVHIIRYKSLTDITYLVLHFRYLI
jgi:hypothetical protein